MGILPSELAHVSTKRSKYPENFADSELSFFIYGLKLRIYDLSPISNEF